MTVYSVVSLETNHVAVVHCNTVCWYMHTYVCKKLTCLVYDNNINVCVRTYMTRRGERMMLQVAVMVCIRLQMTGVGCGVVHIRTYVLTYRSEY